jgi:serine/threonine protein kinase/Tfp pilus assembly protein PilF
MGSGAHVGSRKVGLQSMVVNPLVTAGPGLPEPLTAGLPGIRLESSRVEVRLTRAAVKARLFRQAPQATRIGRFVVLERVGMGGMGIVYAAYDPQLDRRVALKVMRDDVVRSRRPRQQRLLLREARAMAKLSHPNVVAVYDAGTVDDQVFVAMEFVQSRTLREWMGDAHAPAEILRVFREAGQGLAGAHAAGLVHRDFKPENVLVPETGAVRVTDFGIARAADPEGPARSGGRWPIGGETATVASVGIAGTPAYMSPQQMRGETVDARADQWAFCLALYEALAGVRPYDAGALRALARGERLPLPPLPETIAIEPQVRAAIERGLSYEAGARHDDMKAVLAKLRPRRRSRGKWLAGAGASMFVGALAVAAWPGAAACPRGQARLAGVWDAPTQRRAEAAIVAVNPELGTETWQRVAPTVDAYAEQWLDLRQQSCRRADAGELSAELLDLGMACLDSRRAELLALSDTLAHADADVVAHAVESAVRLTPLHGCVDPKVLRELTPPPPPPPLRAASAQIRQDVEHARALRRAGKATAAREPIEACVQQAETLDEPTALIEATLERGRLRAELADREGAAADFDAVIERGAQAGYLTAVAEASVALVDVIGVDLAHYDAGLDMARLASVAVVLGGDAALLRAQLNLARGRVLYVAGRTDEGLTATQQGLDALSGPQATSRQRLERAAALRLLAKLTLAADDPARTTALAEEALAIFEDLLGPRHPDVAATLAHLGAASLRLGRLPEARAQFERAAAIQRDAYGDQHPAYGRTLANLGSTIRASGEAEAALTLYREAAPILERSLGATDPRVASLWVNIGGVEAQLGHDADAEAAYRRGLDGLVASVGERHPQTAVALANLGRLELARGETSGARASLGKALEIRRELLGEDHIETARSLMAWGEVLAAEGDSAAALEAYVTALAALERAAAPADELAEARRILAEARVSR